MARENNDMDSVAKWLKVNDRIRFDTPKWKKHKKYGFVL